MSRSEQPAPGAKAPRRTARRFKILIGVVVALALVWTGGWFAIRHYVAGRITEVEARIAGEGATLSCGDQSLAGFPFKLGITCMPLEASCPAEGLSLRLAGIEAIGLIYNPGHAVFSAKGPIALAGPNGSTLDANWTSLQSSVRIGPSGLKRYSLVTDGLDATLNAPGRIEAPITTRAQHTELHVLKSQTASDAVDLFTTLDQFSAGMPGMPNLPPISTRVAATLPASMVSLSGDPLDAWILSGAPIRIQQFDLDIAGLSTAVTGELTIDGSGLLSGALTVRVSALEALPDLVERFRPGSGQRLARLIGPLSAFLRPVDADGRQWREARVAIQRGRAMVGFIPLGQIPPLGRHRMPTNAAPSPAVDPAPAPLAEAPQTTPVEPAAPPPAEPAPAPEAAPPAGGDAAAALDAVNDLAGAMTRPKRCAVSG